MLNKKKNRLLVTCSLFLVTFLIGGCATGPSSYFRNGEYSGDRHITVAIIPFTNLTNERSADRKVTSALVTHLLKTNYFDVIELGETERAIKDANVRPDEGLSREDINNIGRETGANVLLMGTVDEYKIDSSTMLGEKVFIPEVSINARLVSTGDGSILWAANHHRRGDDRVTIFGIGRIDSISELTDVIVADTINSLVETMNERHDAIRVLKSNGPPAKIEEIVEAEEESVVETVSAPVVSAPAAPPQDERAKVKAQFKELKEKIRSQF